jgi:hypothetical protein
MVIQYDRGGVDNKSIVIVSECQRGRNLKVIFICFWNSKVCSFFLSLFLWYFLFYFRGMVSRMVMEKCFFGVIPGEYY